MTNDSAPSSVQATELSTIGQPLGAPTAADAGPPPHDTALYADLSPEHRHAAAALGWADAASWEAAEQTEACHKSWAQLPTAQQAAAELLGFSAEVWPRGAFWDLERSYGSLGLGRLGSPMAGTSFKTANIGMLLEADVPAACASHPFRRMVTDPSEKSWANSTFSSCIPTAMHGPTCVYWANLTPFSLQRCWRGSSG